jgi:hypothetical protein
VRFTRRRQGVHPALFRQVIALPRIAGAAGRHHVAPLVIAAPRQWNQVVSRETLPMPEVHLTAVAILAAVRIASEEKCIGDLTAEAAGDVDELDESNYRGSGKRESFTSNDIGSVRLDDLGLPLDNQSKGTPDRDHGQRLKGGV